MKFLKHFERAKIPAWEEYYVSYEILSKLLLPFKLMTKGNKTYQGFIHSQDRYKNYIPDLNHPNPYNLSEESITQLQIFTKHLEKLVCKDLEKVITFYTIKLDRDIHKWKMLRINLISYKNQRSLLPLRERNKRWFELKYSFEGLIKRVKLLNEYLSINLEALEKVFKNQDRYVSLYFPQAKLKSRFENYLIKIKVYDMRSRLDNFLTSLENEYLDHFHEDRSEGTQELRSIKQGALLSRHGQWWFGLFAGFTALLMLAIFLLVFNGDVSVDNNEFLSRVFPVYRLSAIIFIYIWLLGWNIYGWISYHINYKYVFGFKHHHSEVWKIFQIAAGFTTLLLVSLLWYLILQDTEGRLANVLSFIPKDILPLIVLLLFVACLFFPHQRWFHGPGRRHFFNLVLEVLKTPFIPVTFTVTWMTDQLASMALSLKDLEYTFCFYREYFQSNESGIKECQSYKRFSRGVVMSLIPLTYRCLQCLRQAYDGPKRISPLLNFGKYCCSIGHTVASYLVNISDVQNTTYFVFWIFFAVTSSLYSYVWDLEEDWGWLQDNAQYKLLRNKLSYKNPVYYYIVMVTDLIMRFAAQLSLSSPVIEPIMKPAVYQFLIGFIAILQRGIWNFFRVENEHQKTLDGFHAVLDLTLPSNDYKFDDKAQEEMFYQDVRVVLGNEDEIQNAKKNMDYFARRSQTLKLTNYSRGESEENVRPSTGFDIKDKELYRLQQVCETPIRIQYTHETKTSEELIDEFFNYIENWKEDLSDMDTWIEEVDDFIQNVLKKKSNRKQKKSIKKTRLSALYPESSNPHKTIDNKYDTGLNIRYERGTFHYDKDNLTENLL